MEALKIQIGGNHYKSDYEIYEYIGDHKLNYTQGNILKYATRFMKKNGLQDLKKAFHYCEMGLESKEEILSCFHEPNAIKFIDANNAKFSIGFLVKLSEGAYNDLAVYINLMIDAYYGTDAQ